MGQIAEEILKRRVTKRAQEILAEINMKELPESVGNLIRRCATAEVNLQQAMVALEIGVQSNQKACLQLKRAGEEIKRLRAERGN